MSLPNVSKIVEITYSTYLGICMRRLYKEYVGTKIKKKTRKGLIRVKILPLHALSPSPYIVLTWFESATQGSTSTKRAQPRSQALSPLPPFVVGRKTLVAAGHVTTQNLGGKKICWTGGVAEYFDCCCGKLCGFQNLEQSLKKLPAIVGFCR